MRLDQPIDAHTEAIRAALERGDTWRTICAELGTNERQLLKVAKEYGLLRRDVRYDGTRTEAVLALARRGSITPQRISEIVGVSVQYVGFLCCAHNLLAERHPVTGEWYYPRWTENVTAPDPEVHAWAGIIHLRQPINEPDSDAWLPLDHPTTPRYARRTTNGQCLGR